MIGSSLDRLSDYITDSRGQARPPRFQIGWRVTAELVILGPPDADHMDTVEREEKGGVVAGYRPDDYLPDHQMYYVRFDDGTERTEVNPGSIVSDEVELWSSPAPPPSKRRRPPV